MPDKKVTYQIRYNNRNISADIAPYFISLTYIDKTEKEADELDITLEDSQQLWQNEWYPEKGAAISVEIIQGGNVLNCGTFRLDEVTLSGSKDGGDTVTLRGVAAGFNKKLRTKKSYAHENKTLREIANTVAAANGLTIQGNVPAVTLERSTQHQETDLAYLKRIAGIYGVVFSVRENLLIFTSIFEVEARGASLTFDKSDLTDYTVTDKSVGTYQSAQVKFHNPMKKKVVKAANGVQTEAANAPGADTLELRGKAENQQQAEMQSKAALHRANSRQQGGSISFPGNILFVAGNNVNLQGLGNLSGKYHITQSTHTVNRDGGYAGSGEIKRLALIAAEKRKAAADSPAPMATSLTGAGYGYTPPTGKDKIPQIDDAVFRPNR